MTGDRSLIAGRISSLTDDKMVLRLPDRDDVNLVGLRPRDLPGEHPARARRSGPGPGSRPRWRCLRRTRPAWARPPRCGRSPPRPPPGPPAPAGSSGRSGSTSCRPGCRSPTPGPCATRPWPARPLWALVGVGGDDLAALGPDLADGVPSFIVGGPAKSGRSSVLLAMARSLLAAGTGLVIAAPRPSPLRALDGRPGVAAVFTGSDLTAEELTTALARLAGPAVVMIDDAEGATRLRRE